MLETWAGEIDTMTLNKILEDTEGFSGAHMKELVNFAKMIAEEESLDIGVALLGSLQRLKEQKELIDQIRANRRGIKSIWGSLKWVDGDIKQKEVVEVLYEPSESKIMVDIKDAGEDEEVEEKAEEDEKKYTCECIKCGHTITTDEHCKDVECPKCGGDMRRAERPGPGRSVDEESVEAKAKPISNADFDAIMKEVREELAELRIERELTEKQRKELEDIEAIIKEGRILSTKNRTLVKDIMESLERLKTKLEELYNATEPPGKVEVDESKQLVEIEDTKEREAMVDVVDTKKEEEANLTPEQIGEIVEVALTKSLSDGKIADVIKEGHEMAYKKLTGKVE